MAKTKKLTLWERPGFVTSTSGKVAKAAEVSVKGDPVFPRSNAAGWIDFMGRSVNRYPGSDLNYSSAIGDLTNSSLVVAPCNFLGTMLSEAPPEVLERDKKGGLTQIEEHPLTQMLEQPNPFHTGDAFWLAFAIDWFCNGNVYWLKQRESRYLKVTALWYLPAFMVTPIWDRLEPGTFISAYRYRVEGQTQDYLPDDIVHFKRGLSQKNPRIGVGAFDSILREIYGDHMVANFSAVLLKNFGVVPFVISPKTAASGDVGIGFGPDPAAKLARAQAIKETFIAGTTGDHRGEPIVNTIPLDVTKLGFDPKELELSKLHAVPESRVSAVTGIPAQVLQFLVGLENGTNRATYEEAVTQAYNMCVKPIQLIAQSTIKKDLLPEFGSPRGNRQIFRFDFSKVQALQEDRNKLYERAGKALADGGTTVNEFRESIGKPTKDGLDIFLIPRTSLPVTLETMLLLAKDPAALLGAMPAEQSLATPTTVPSNGKPKSLNGHRHNGSNGHHRSNEHGAPSTTVVPRMLKGKSVEYDGMTLWRDPTELEKLINLKAIQDAFDSGEKDLKKQLLALREQLISDAAAGIIKLSPADYHTLTLSASADVSTELRDTLQTIYERGRELVLSELEAQGATGLGTIGAISEADIAALDLLSGVTISRVLNDVQARAVGSAASASVAGITGDEVGNRVESDLEEGSTAYIDTAAGGADHVALSMGRSGEADDRSDIVSSVYFSCILDDNSCTPCSEADGETGETEDSIPPAPLDSCDGGPERCRCIHVYVFASEV